MKNTEPNAEQPSVSFNANPHELCLPSELSTDTQLAQKSPVLPQGLSRTAPSGWTSHKGYVPLGSPPSTRPLPIIGSKESLNGNDLVDLVPEKSSQQRYMKDSDNVGLYGDDFFGDEGATSTNVELTSSLQSMQTNESHESQLAVSSSYSTEGNAFPVTQGLAEATDSLVSQASPPGSSQVSQLSFTAPTSLPLPTILERSQSPVHQTSPLVADMPENTVRKYEAQPDSLVVLPQQRQRIAHRNGVSFTLMVAGESGSGKSTFVQMLLGDSSRTTRQVSRLSNLTGRSQAGPLKPLDVHRTTEIEIHECVVEENGFLAQFTIVDTPGFGDYTNNLYAWVPITNYIDSQYQRYMCEEEQPSRMRLTDTRVHVCIYFLQPTCHDLLPLDITAMKEIGSRVNLVLVISKSDSQTVDEVSKFKQIVRRCVEKHNIPVFSVEEESSNWPYALVSSAEMVRATDGREVYGRQYDWGTVEVDNPAHSDLPRLKQVLMSTHMLHLIDTTHEQHYKKQRREMRLSRLCLALKNGSKASTGTKGGHYPSFTTSKFSMFSPRDGQPEQILKSPLPSEAKSTMETQDIDELVCKMTGLEILTAVSPFGHRFLEEQRIEEDLLYKQRVRGITKQFGIVLKFQLQRFEQEARDLETKDQQFRAELEELELGNKLLEQRIAELEANTTRRKK